MSTKQIALNNTKAGTRLAEATVCIERAVEQDESNTELLKVCRQLEILTDSFARLQEHKKNIENTASDWQQFAIKSEDRNLRLEYILAKVRRERDVLEVSFGCFLSDLSRESDISKHKKIYQHLNLSNRCVLYIGVCNDQCTRFRSLVEQYNGRFIHHNGGRESSWQHLGIILSQADAVLCHLDCISDYAVRRVKNLSQCHGTKLILLPGLSLAMFIQKLSELVVCKDHDEIC